MEQATRDAEAILNRIRQLVRTLRSFDRDAQSRYGLGAAQMFILHVLRQEDNLTVGELAERTATDQSSASLAVSRLVEQGHVQRGPDPVDRRQVRLSLTRKGRTLVRRAPPATQQGMIASVAKMSAADRRRFIALLDQLLDGMGADQSQPPMFFEDEPQR